MPNPPNPPDQSVHLQVKVKPATMPAGWTECQNNASYTNDYIYKYTGGNPRPADPTHNRPADPPGSFVFSTGGGTKTVSLDLISSAGFSISDVDIKYDGSTDPSDVTASDDGDGTWTISDTAVDQETGTFKVYVDHGDDQKIECDPRWVND